MENGNAGRTPALKRNISPFGAWGLSFGFAVGWGAFVMPGAEFLPGAGPLGTVLGILAGALAMAVVGWNYHRMTNEFPGPSGACLFAARAFGADYGFLTAWSLSLAYMAILWANATALVLLARYMFGDVLQFGWHDTLAGFDIYLGEVLLSVAVMVAAGLVCLWGKRLAWRVQAVLAAAMLAGAAICFFAALAHNTGGAAAMAPAFAPGCGGRFAQVLRIVAMMPWAFVGFEAVSHSSGEFRFPAKKLWRILLASIAAAVAMYAMLAAMPALARPEGCATWPDYIKVKSGLSGLDSISTFAAARVSLGKAGVAAMGAAMFGRLGETGLSFADNGREALEMLSAPDAPRFDLVLTDAWMPEMTGMELVSAIRADPAISKTPVYLFTAEVEMKDTFAAAGFDGMLLKPANLQSLRKLLK